MKKQNLIVLSAAIGLIVLVGALAFLLPENRTVPKDAPAVQVAQEPSATQRPAAEAYLLITVQGVVYEPLPLTGEGSFTLTQGDGAANTVRITPDSVCMEHSTCENQDCVDQGIVTLENMDDRALRNLIICLPNQVTLELHTPESLQRLLGGVE